MYVGQLLGFIDPTHPDFIFKLDKTLYGLKQAPRLSIFLISNGFVKGIVDTVLFTKHVDSDILLFKFMLMILYLDLLMKNFAKILNHI